LRLIYNPDGDAADILAYPSALVEGRLAGKYLLSREKLPDTVVVQGVKRKGILAGADVRVDKESAKDLTLDKSDTTLLPCFDAKDMLSIEQKGQEQSAQPSELEVPAHREQLRSENPVLRSR